VGKSITGGHVYRGKLVPELQGAYLYADFVSGQIWALWYDAEKKEVTANRSIIPTGLPVMSFGEDDAGEVYYVTQDGGIYKFASPKKTAQGSRD
jgi:quinoprotein glucose dehydrogenase